MWATTEFKTGLCEFHKENRKSLIRASEMIGNSVGTSFSRTLGNGFRQTIANILSKEEMTSSKLQEGHVQATIERCKTYQGKLIVAQDSVLYDYSGHKSMEGLKKLNKKSRGLVQHNALVIREDKLPLGLIHQRTWTRKGFNCYSLEGKKESYKWSESLEAVNTHLGSLPNEVLLVQDREADIYSFFSAKRAPNVELLVRLYVNRKYELEGDPEVLALIDLVKDLPLMGKHQTQIERNNKEVTLDLSIQFGSVGLTLPSNQKGERPEQKVSIVIATETGAYTKNGEDCYNKKKPTQWILLTTKPVTTIEEARIVVDDYAKRWIVERFHLTNKSGALEVERLQFDDVQTTINALSLYSIVAWRILHLTHYARINPEESADTCFDQNEIKIIETSNKTSIQTVFQAVRALAKMVGFVPTTRQPLPGLKILGEALAKLNTIKLFLIDAAKLDSRPYHGQIINKNGDPTR